MKLNVWLRQGRSTKDRLRVIERLAQALNEFHDRGEPLAALDPDRIDVDEDEIDITGCRRGAPGAGYAAPERAEGGPPSSEADVYAAGAIAWEILAGRAYATSPAHLAEAAPDVPRELADAVMACLEQSPQWRPRDLTYLAQLAGHAQGQKAVAEKPPRTTPTRTPAARPAPRSSARPAAPLGGSVRESRGGASHVPLAIAAAVVVAAAGFGVYWLTRAKTPQPAATATTPTSAPSALSITASPVAGASPSPTSPTRVADARPSPAIADPTLATMPAAPAPSPVPTVRATATPTSIAVLTPPPTQPARTPDPTAAAVATTTTTTQPAVRTSVTHDPPLVSAISPLSVRRPGKQIFDLRGSGLRPEMRAYVVPVKNPPRGITVLRQICKSSTLFQVLLDIDEKVSPGPYGIALEDATGAQTTPALFTVTK